MKILIYMKTQHIAEHAGIMKILITGIGNIGKSTLREKIAHAYPDKVFQIDMDYHDHDDIPHSSTKNILVEDVHGLEKNPQQYDWIIYLMPPPFHVILWFKRAWAWFSGGKVDLSNPKGINKRYAIYNIPVIFKIVAENLLRRKKWVKNDLFIIDDHLKYKTTIVENQVQGYDKVIEIFEGER